MIVFPLIRSVAQARVGYCYVMFPTPHRALGQKRRVDLQ
jgi:hypothetical protein